MSDEEKEKRTELVRALYISRISAMLKEIERNDIKQVSVE